MLILVDAVDAVDAVDSVDALDAGRGLAALLDRVPLQVRDGCDCEVLVVGNGGDPAGGLRTGYAPTSRHLPVRVLSTSGTPGGTDDLPDDPGYGGIRKLGCAYAVRQGFDLLALLHRDGRYPPEELPVLASPVLRGEADAVLGSRPARAGARILTGIHNALTGAHLSAWHSGFRVYSVAALRRIQIQRTDDGPGFDTEILLQLQHAGARIIEVPVAIDGDEPGPAGLRDAGRAVAASMGSFLHRHGLTEQRRLVPVGDAQAPYDVKLGFPSSHTYALAAVPDGASVLDLGAGPGGMAAALVGKGCRVGVVDVVPPDQVPPGVAVHVQDLEGEPGFPVADYDILMMLDVIEHLRDPERFLDRLREHFAARPVRLVLSTPNVAFVALRIGLAAGQFSYAREGILDRTHTRLFTFRTLRRLLRDAGFRDIRMRGVPAPFPKMFGNNRVGRVLLRLNLALIRLSPRLFSYQIFVEARPTPTVGHRLELALRSG